MSEIWSELKEMEENEDKREREGRVKRGKIEEGINNKYI